MSLPIATKGLYCIKGQTATLATKGLHCQFLFPDKLPIIARVERLSINAGTISEVKNSATVARQNQNQGTVAKQNDNSGTVERQADQSGSVERQDNHRATLEC